jgi:hypothetical protein
LNQSEVTPVYLFLRRGCMAAMPLGFRAGKKQETEFVDNGISAGVQAKPASFNFLKINDNAFGTLNSQL